MVHIFRAFGPWLHGPWMTEHTCSLHGQPGNKHRKGPWTRNTLQSRIPNDQLPQQARPPSFPHLQTPLIRTLRVQSLLNPTFEHYSNIQTCGGHFKPKSQQYLSCETHKWDPSDLCKGLSVQRLLKDSPQGNNIRTTQDLLEIQVQGLDSHPCIRNL